MNSPTLGMVGSPMSSRNKQEVFAKELREVKNLLSQNKANVKALPGSRRARRNRRAARVEMAGATGPSGFARLPAARSFSSGRSAAFAVRNLPRHADYGDGIVVSGCEVALSVVTGAAADFFLSSVATADTINSMKISPDKFNGRLALTARNYSRFRFRKLRVHFIPGLGTTNPGLATMGYSPDADVGTFATLSFASVTQMEPSVVFSLNAPVSIDLIDYKGDQLYYTESDSATSAGIRQTAQGTLLGFPSSVYGALIQGAIWAEYVVELFSPSVDYGFTMTRLEEKLARTYIRSKRLETLSEGEEADTQKIIMIEGKPFVSA